MEALGYVGFGISPNGGMAGSDVVIGWVKDDGTAVFHVRMKVNYCVNTFLLILFRYFKLSNIYLTTFLGSPCNWEI